MARSELKGDRCLNCNGSGTVIADVGGGLKAEVDCTECHGTGLVNSPNACTECKGSGSVVADIGGGLKAEVDCPHCKGSKLEPIA